MLMRVGNFPFLEYGTTWEMSSHMRAVSCRGRGGHIILGQFDNPAEPQPGIFRQNHVGWPLDSIRHNHAGSKRGLLRPARRSPCHLSSGAAMLVILLLLLLLLWWWWWWWWWWSDYACVTTCVFTCMHPYVPTYLPTYRPTFQPT